MVSDLRKYLDEELPRESLLGHLVIYTINDGEYERDKIVDWFSELEMNPKFIPAGSKPIDAYRKATNDVDDFEYEIDKILTGHDDEGKPTYRRGSFVSHVLVRDVLSDDKLIERHLIREIRDGRRRALAHSKIGEAVFYRPRVENNKTVPDSHRFRLHILHGELAPGERAPLDAVVKKISASFDRHLNYLDGMKVRGMVRDYISELDGIQLKPSVYFIPIAQVDELAKVTALVDRLGHGCQMQLVGLMDTAKQRDIVVQAWQSETQDALKELVEKMAHLRATRKKISPEAYRKIRAEYDAIVARGDEYRKTLSITVDATKNAAEVATAHLEKLWEDAMLSDAA